MGHPDADLFFLDDHAADLPTSTPADPEARRTILGLLEISHPRLVRGDPAVEVMHGPSVGARSYRVGDHFVKVLTRPAAVDQARLIAPITAALGAAGIPIEPPVPGATGAPVSEVELAGTGRAYLYVQRFVDGGFFDGTTAQLEAMLPALYGMGPALRAVAPVPSQRTAYEGWEPLPVLKAVATAIERRSASGQMDGFDELVREHLPVHLRTAETYDAAEVRSTTLHHFDLHPHNLLFRSGALTSVLDLGGFHAVPDDLAIGFAFYKLGRKGVSLGRMAPADVRTLARRRSDMRVLSRLARIEVTRRASVVLGLHYIEGNTEWDRDVRKQMVGPREIDALFLS